jgi:hypothetical protein
MLLGACAAVSTEVSVAKLFERGALHGLNLKFICGDFAQYAYLETTTHGCCVKIVIDDSRSVKRRLNLMQIDGLIGCAFEN